MNNWKKLFLNIKYKFFYLIFLEENYLDQQIKVKNRYLVDKTILLNI
jgi:hypothetical protein